MSVGAIWTFDENGQLAPVKSFPQAGVLLVSCLIKPGTTRVEARDRIRSCVREALVEWLGLSLYAITFNSIPGHAPRLIIDGLPEPGFSISHEVGLSLAAVNLQGPVGIDVMQVQDVADWQVVAQDYLGPHVAAGLMNMSEATRPGAFARAWCEREALLKLHGCELAEWGAMERLDGVGVEVDLGGKWVGVVAVLHAASQPVKKSCPPARFTEWE
ncbi:4'-phosphopantetheinyl transferase superfamily protein [Pseudomonas syringae USA007]|uniref:4'-phosphopantetheinyl transferase superfamily protein n=1 Tax=Pseudomonas syringae USA007 TaxID=1357288 RepID=A0AAU8M966_PSESX|nr:4'-phosphopantetheinyl transferase superfamily protein [Pseudomonas syringae]